MQIDLHFTGIYALCRIAGMQSTYAGIVAYASQYVDDAVYPYALNFRNGGFFKQIGTGHKLLAPRNFDIDEALEIWLPFHYLPRCQNTDPDALITGPDSRLMALLLEDIRSASSAHLLYRLGIGLHCFADAFSHQDFTGFYNAYNDVQLMQSAEEKGPKDNAGRLTRKLLEKWRPDSLAIGHGAVQNNPDIPYAEWAYARSSKIIRVKNLEERYLPCLKNIYDYLVYFLGKNPQYTSNCKIREFEDYLEKFHQLLAFRGNKEERYENWLRRIKDNYFEFIDFDTLDRSLSYNEKNWFNQAVEAIKVSKATNLNYQKYNYHAFRKKEGFEDSPWVKYMQAAAEHQFLIVHCLLPELGIIIG